MVKLTRSLKQWLLINYDRYDRETLALIQFGHTELMTKEMWDVGADSVWAYGTYDQGDVGRVYQMASN